MIIDKISNIRKDLKNLLPILSSVRLEISKGKDDVKLGGKTLRQANQEQSSKFGYYDEIRAHLSILSQFIQIKLDERRGVLIREIAENSEYDYGERSRDKMIESDSGYVELKLKKMEVDEILEYAKSVTEQFRMRAFTLNNISKLVAAQAQDEYFVLDNE